MFDAAKEKERIVTWIRDWFKKNGEGCNAVIGISGGKDSTILAALCAEALGKDKVIGVLMPNGYQADYDDAKKVVKTLGINYITLNIKCVINEINDLMHQLVNDFTKQYEYNLPPRIRMAMLYGVAQNKNGRVICTTNASEYAIGWGTRWGDTVGDLAPFREYTKTEVVAIGDLCENIPYELIHKAPADGLTTKTDEDNFGFTYQELDNYLNGVELNDFDTWQRITDMERRTEFKRKDIAHVERTDK